MDFELNEEQALFRKTLHEWVERGIPKSMARQWEADEFNYPEELWDRMSRMGLHAIGIPEEYGGQGGDVITQVIVARELARSLAGSPGSGASPPSAPRRWPRSPRRRSATSSCPIWPRVRPAWRFRSPSRLAAPTSSGP